MYMPGCLTCSSTDATRRAKFGTSRLKDAPVPREYCNNSGQGSHKTRCRAILYITVSRQSPAKPGVGERGPGRARYRDRTAIPGNSRQKRVKPGNSRMSDAQATYGTNAGRCTRQMRFGGISGVQYCLKHDIYT